MKKIKTMFKSKKLIAIVLIVFAIAIELFYAIIYHFIFNFNHISFPETLYYSTQILGSVFVTSGVIIAVWQYYLSSKSVKTDLEIQQVQRAIDLSAYYKDNILNYYRVIKYIFNKTRITEITETLPSEKMYDFDIHELTTLFSNRQIKKLKKIQKSDIFAQTAMEAISIYGLDRNQKQDISGTTDTSTRNKMMLAYVSSLTTSLLNNMEFFALHFAHQTADESVVYQSLHQTYLEIVKDMYYTIASSNTNSTNKYYTNIIWLYNIWYTKKINQDNERSRNFRLIQSSGTIVGNDIKA